MAGSVICADLARLFPGDVVVSDCCDSCHSDDEDFATGLCDDYLDERPDLVVLHCCTQAEAVEIILSDPAKRARLIAAIDKGEF